MSELNHIAIVGCGPAGLSAALALHDVGFNITLFERFQQPQAVGSGLMLQPTGLAVLEQLGLRARVEQLGQTIGGMLGRVAPGGKIVLDINYHVLAGNLYGVAIHRASLFHVLYGAVLKRGITVETGSDICGLYYHSTNDDDFRAVSLLDERGTRSDQRFDLVVDASGSHSKLVSTMAGQPPRTALAYGALWATVKLEGTDFSRDLLEQRYAGASVMVGVLPCGQLPDNPSEVATLFWSLKSTDYQSILHAGIDRWKQDVNRQWPAVQPLTDQLGSFNDLTHAKYAHQTMRTPFRRKLVFIGDAAHSTSPQLGQGVNMALLDAAALTAALTAGRNGSGSVSSTATDNLTHRLQRYAQARRYHVRLYQVASYLLTPFYQSDSRIMPMLRDALFGPVSKLPYADRLVTALGAGLLTKPVQSIAKIAND